MYGPFRTERGTTPLLLPSLDDVLLRGIVPAGPPPLGDPPRRDRRPSARGLPLASPQRVIDRVHRHAAHLRPLSQPPGPARLSDRHVLVIQVPHLPDRRLAV